VGGYFVIVERLVSLLQPELALAVLEEHLD